MYFTRSIIRFSKSPHNRGNKKLNFEHYIEKNICPANDQLCDEAVWLPQNVLLSTKKDMDDIANAIVKIQQYAGAIKLKS